MKKILLLLVMIVMCSAVFFLAACGTTKTPLKDALGNTLAVTDYKLAGEAVGEAGYYAYCDLKQDAKYDKYTAYCEQIYAALEAAQGGDASAAIDAAAINDAALQVLNVVLAAKYGPSQAALITAGARLGLGFAYNLVKRNIPEDKLTLYLDGVWAGIQKAKKNGADWLKEPTEIDVLVKMEPSEECGLQCIEDKIRAKLDAGGLTEYDRKRLEKRLDHFQKEKEKIEKEVAEDVGFCGESAK